MVTTYLWQLQVLITIKGTISREQRQNMVILRPRGNLAATKKILLSTRTHSLSFKTII